MERMFLTAFLNGIHKPALTALARFLPSRCCQDCGACHGFPELCRHAQGHPTTSSPCGVRSRASLAGLNGEPVRCSKRLYDGCEIGVCIIVSYIDT